MKHLLIALFILSQFNGKSQAKITMASSYFISPNDTIMYGDTVSLIVYVKNTGNASFSGQISVQGKRDTTLGGSCGSSTLTNSALLPNDSMQTSLVFTPSFADNFKVNGNVNTIVVWPYIAAGSGVIGDSLRVILWISNPNSVPENKRNAIRIFPNPVSDLMYIKSLTPSNFKLITIYDVFAKKVKELEFNDTINLSDLSSGSYWIILRSSNELYRIPFIKE